MYTNWKSSLYVNKQNKIKRKKGEKNEKETAE